MARNRTESVLGLPPLRRQSGFETAMSLALLGNNRDINERERGIYANLHEQEVVIDAGDGKVLSSQFETQ